MLIFNIAVSCLILSLSPSWAASIPKGVDPDASMNVMQLAQSKGYICEEHKVITEDGYILGVFRIPHGRKSTNVGRPVLLQHGLLDSAASWVINYPEQSLAFILADAGYDVWMGNMRGNTYSRAHVKYDPDKDDAFWDFSWDDMARDDLPSMVKYILKETQQSKIAYVGHSQGTMIGFAQFSQPDSSIANNISFWAALAPVAHVGHIESPIRYLANPTIIKDIEQYWHQLFGRNEFLPSSAIIKWFATHECDKLQVDRLVCENIFFVLFGPETKNLNETRVPVYAAHEPSGTSVKNMVHFAQGVETNSFQEYDYGSPSENQKHYNQTTPPQYTISAMQVPTAIFTGSEDWLADPTDVKYIMDNVKNVVFQKNIPDYNHVDFIWALTANTLVYADLVNVMEKYHPAN